MTNIPKHKRNVDLKNKHGLRTSRARSKLKVLSANVEMYRPSEFARDLVKYAYSIDPQVTVTTAQKLEMDDVNCS